jgi:hypothetical protein
MTDEALEALRLEVTVGDLVEITFEPDGAGTFARVAAVPRPGARPARLGFFPCDPATGEVWPETPYVLVEATRIRAIQRATPGA